jgi:hypothetical protein
MRELIPTSYYPDKRGLRKIVNAAGAALALTACEPSITKGVVYRKEHTEQHTITVPRSIGRPIIYVEAVKPEKWEIYIAQCPRGELPPQEKINKECKTKSFDIPAEIYNKLQIGQHANFSKIK